ncbi:hypothetical protein EDC04DRAFT_2583890, partial [Pisolithus marmoratus]
TKAPFHGSDRRKLKQRVIVAYNVSPEIGDILVPEGLMSQKFATNTNEQGMILFLRGMFFVFGYPASDMSRSPNVVPVYTLWKKYDLLPCITTPASVLPVLVGGTDLMIPGDSFVQTVVPPQLVAIAQYVTDSPTMRGPPLAVGRLEADLDKLKARGKGKAIHLLHSWKDYLFAVGSKADPPQGRKARREKQLGQMLLVNKASRVRKFRKLKVQSLLRTQCLDLRCNNLDQRPSSPKKVKVSTILRNAVLQAIRGILKSLPTSSFPIPAGTFYSSYVLPYRPAFVRRNVPGTDSSSTPSGNDGYTSEYPPIDIKHSTYKSLAAFLKILDKQGILTIKDMKPEPLVMSVSASHSEVLSHTPYVSLRDIQLKEEKREKRDEEERAKVQAMEIKELWKPHTPSGSARFFTEGGFDSSALYTYADLKATVIKYVTARQLVNVHDQAHVNVGQDEVLLSTFAGKNENGDSLEFLKREEVVQRLSEKMQNWYEIRAEGQEPLLRKGQLKPISVVVKTRQGRRASTLISGFEPFLLEAEEMAEELRRICAGSTGVSPLPGKPTRSEALVQGKQTKAVVDFLLSKGVPKKWIETADLTVKK